MVKAMKLIKQMDAEKGYLVQNRSGDYLSRRGVWFPHEDPEDAYMYSEDELRSLDWSNWQSKPWTLICATYSPRDGVKVSRGSRAEARALMIELGLAEE